MKRLLIALLAVATPIMAEAQTNPVAQSIAGTRLDLQARGDVRVVPDIATISAGVVTDGVDAASAMRENAARMAGVMAALKKLGIADRDVQTQSISLQPQYRYVENKPPVVTGYQASNQLTVRFRDIGKAGAILDVLVREGVNQINGPTLSVEKPEAALDQARIAALKTLQQRAQIYAKAVGMTVKRIVVISEVPDYGAPVPVMAMAKAEMASDATTSVRAGEQSIGITISAVFELQ
ncbi:MAG: hypothetical protein RIS52_1474 [Pseudomonadota bacterium]|jgi:uncharacterized protein